MDRLLPGRRRGIAPHTSAASALLQTARARKPGTPVRDRHRGQSCMIAVDVPPAAERSKLLPSTLGRNNLSSVWSANPATQSVPPVRAAAVPDPPYINRASKVVARLPARSQCSAFWRYAFAWSLMPQAYCVPHERPIVGQLNLVHAGRGRPVRVRRQEAVTGRHFLRRSERLTPT